MAYKQTNLSCNASYDSPQPSITTLIATIVYTGIVSFILLKILDSVMGLRVDEDEEAEGLDVALHDERGYNLSS